MTTRVIRKETILTYSVNGEKLFVPKRNKNFYKFWWNEELSVLKRDATENNRFWKISGRPRSGPVFDRRRLSRTRYRKRLRECEQQLTLSYTNDLHYCERMVQISGNVGDRILKNPQSV